MNLHKLLVIIFTFYICASITGCGSSEVATNYKDSEKSETEIKYDYSQFKDWYKYYTSFCNSKENIIIESGDDYFYAHINNITHVCDIDPFKSDDGIFTYKTDDNCDIKYDIINNKIIFNNDIYSYYHSEYEYHLNQSILLSSNNIEINIIDAMPIVNTYKEDDYSFETDVTVEVLCKFSNKGESQIDLNTIEMCLDNDIILPGKILENNSILNSGESKNVIVTFIIGCDSNDDITKMAFIIDHKKIYLNVNIKEEQEKFEGYYYDKSNNSFIIEKIGDRYFYLFYCFKAWDRIEINKNQFMLGDNQYKNMGKYILVINNNKIINVLRRRG